MRKKLTVACFIKGSLSIFSSQFHALLLLMLLMEFLCDTDTFYSWSLLSNFRESMDANYKVLPPYHQKAAHPTHDFSNTYQSESYVHWFSDPSKFGNGMERMLKLLD